MPHRPDPVKYAAAKKRLTKNLKRMIRESQELQVAEGPDAQEVAEGSSQLEDHRRAALLPGRHG